MERAWGRISELKTARKCAYMQKMALPSAPFSHDPHWPPAGPVLAFVYAVKELLEECKSGGTCLPANVVFLIEGEEENVRPWGVVGSAAQGLLYASRAAVQCSRAEGQLSNVNPGLLCLSA